MKSISGRSLWAVQPDQYPHDPARWQIIFSTIGVAAIGIGQPILDLLGRNPDFFIARAAPAGDVVLLGMLLGVAIPLALAALVLLGLYIRPIAGKILHILILVGMGGLVASSILRQSPINDGPWAVVIAVALLVGVLLAWGYYRSSWVRPFLSFIGLAPILVVFVFLALSPASEVAWGIDDEIESRPVAVGEPAPLVMVVFDEFPVSSIIDSQGRIREEHFPAIADLSDHATWFRNAVSPHQGTRDALPEILTGISQEQGEKLPHYADHPSNLFTLLSGEYRVNAIETLTQLCPDSVCVEGSREAKEFQGRWSSLGEDLAIVTGHLYLPGGLSDGLPPIDQNWGDFRASSVARPDNWSIRDRMRAEIEDDRRTDVEEFLNQLEDPLRANEFHFVHLPIPHTPWFHMADGRTYNSGGGHPGSDDNGWGSNAWLVEQAYQRHLLEVQYADHIVGSVVRSLKETGSYEKSMLVVASDHGIAIRPGLPRRSIRSETVGDIAAVPLFIKAPGQTQENVDDYRAELTDILPTIAGVLGIEVPWEVDGVDLFGPARPDRAESTITNSNGTVRFGTEGQEKLQVAEYHAQFFEDRGPFGLAPPGYVPVLGEMIEPTPDPLPRVNFTLDSPELYTDVQLNVDHLPIRLTGTLSGPVSPGEVVAIAIESRVVAVTEIWEEDDSHRFQALLPPSELKLGANEFEFYMVDRTNEDYEYSSISRP